MDSSPVERYLAAAPEPHRTTLTSLRTTLRALLPDAEETLSYGVPAFKVAGKAVAGFAYFAKHCSYFPHSGSVLAQLADELGDFRWSKGTLQFAPDAPLPDELVNHLVKARRRELGA